MRTIDIDHKDYQAIRREIGERLRLELGIELELPACLKGKLDELCGLEGKSSSVVPDVELGFKNKAKREREPRRKVVAHLAVVAQS